MAARKNPKVKVAYDRPVDVLHVAVGEPVPYEGDGLPRGIELDYALEDDAAVGAKVIGFKRNGWSDEVQALSEQIAGFLKIDTKRLVGEIERAVKS